MPMTIAQVRQQYPQYNNMSDGQLADALHSKYYSDMPKDEFNQKIGIAAPQDQVEGVPVTPDQPQVDQGQPQQPVGMMGELAGAGVGAVQGATTAAYGIADLSDKVLNKILGTHLQAHDPDIYSILGAEKLKGSLGAKAGEIAGQIAPAVATGGATAETTLGRMLATGAGAFATQPGGMLKRGTVGAGAALTGGLLEAAGRPSTFLIGKLAKKIESSKATQKTIANNLYDTAFKGTEKVKPLVSEKTMNDIVDLKNRYPGKRSFINKTINAYKENPNPRGLHNLKSDLMDEASDLVKKRDSAGGLEQYEKDTLRIISGESKRVGNKVIKVPGLVDSLSEDLQKNMDKVSPKKSAQYSAAQLHWKNNVVPFKKYKSLRDLLSSERTVDPKLYTDLAKDERSSIRLRDVLGIKRSEMQLGKFVHRKYYGLPMPVALTAGGAGIYTLRHKIEELM